MLALLIGLGVGILAVIVIVVSPNTYYEERSRRIVYDPTSGRVTYTERHIRSGPTGGHTTSIVQPTPTKALTYNREGIIDVDFTVYSREPARQLQQIA